MFEHLFRPQLADSMTASAAVSKLVSSKVVCVGRNYVAHAKELDNPVPKEPLLFIKSTNSLVPLEQPISIPTKLGECHHELELALLIGKTTHRGEGFDKKVIAGVGIGLDLTLRELQKQLKSKGHPWEKAKNFDASCPVSRFVDCNQFPTLSNIRFSMKKNGQLVQQGDTLDMIFPIEQLIQDISSCFTLYPGDIVLTGTPSGVAPLAIGDELEFYLQDRLFINTEVTSSSH